MQKTLFKTRGISYQTPEGFMECVLEYYILEQDSADQRVYGVEVRKLCGDKVLDCSCVEDLTVCADEIEDVCLMLCSYSVTPVTLTDILSDWADARDHIKCPRTVYGSFNLQA